MALTAFETFSERNVIVSAFYKKQTKQKQEHHKCDDCKIIYASRTQITKQKQKGFTWRKFGGDPSEEESGAEELEAISNHSEKRKPTSIESE